MLLFAFKIRHNITLKEIPEELKDILIPTRKYMTKQYFWFNKKYMEQQIKDFIKSYKKTEKDLYKNKKTVYYIQERLFDNKKKR